MRNTYAQKFVTGVVLLTFDIDMTSLLFLPSKLDQMLIYNRYVRYIFGKKITSESYIFF
jgi:hypothetical protein